tara:strand:+ start:77 stop:190 length:114 start_codon:yes stop_codon:yes gene_type:complete
MGGKQIIKGLELSYSTLATYDDHSRTVMLAYTILVVK